MARTSRTTGGTSTRCRAARGSSWRYHYPQAAFPYDDLIETNAGRSKFEREYELHRHRRLRRRPLLDRRGRLRQGRRRPTSLMRITVRNRGAGEATLHVLPTLWFRERVVVGPGRRQAGAVGGSRRTVDPGDAPGARRLHARGRPGAGRHAADAALLRERDEPRADRRGPADRRPTRRTASTTTSSAAPRPSTRTRIGTEGRRLVPGHRAGRRDGRAAAAPPQADGRGARRRRTSSGRRSRQLMKHARGRGRRVLRGPPTRGRDGRGTARHAPGVRRDALEQAVLRLQRRPLARWRSRAAAAATRAQDRAQRRLAPLRRGRHPVDARPVGVPVVRGLGPRLPRGHPRPHRPDVRQVPAAPDVSRVVPAPERRAARLRVVVRRRQPAGPRGGGVPRLDDRREAGHRLPQADLQQAAAQLHVVAQPRGPGGQRPLLGRLPRPRQHRRLRSVAPARRRGAGTVRRHGLDVHVLPVDAADRDRAGRDRPRLRGLRDDLPRARRPDRRPR